MREQDPADVDGEGLFVRHRHVPPHLFRAGATYFVTARTLDGVPAMSVDARKQRLIEALRFAAEQRGWAVVAWVVLSNHYHCILTAPREGEPEVSALLASVHKFTATTWNRADGTRGRKIWYQFWDTCLTSEGSFWARVNYVHWNPVKHGLVTDPEAYSFGSYREWQGRDDWEVEMLEQAFPWDRLELD